jgi:hypothetical protein
MGYGKDMRSPRLGKTAELGFGDPGTGRKKTPAGANRQGSFISNRGAIRTQAILSYFREITISPS